MDNQNELIIEASRSSKLNLKELWRYRELFFFFAWRDIKVRYKQTFIGVGWAILQPVLSTGVFTLFFNKVAGISTGNAHIPYPLFAYLGMMYWNSFQSTLNNAGNALLTNSGVMTKVYFPRLLPLLSATALSFVDFFFASTFFVLLLVIYLYAPHLAGILLFIPGVILIQYSALAIGIFFAALNVRYRDVRTALPFITQILFFVTPVIYPITLIPARFRFLVNLNPAAGPLDLVKAGIFGTSINWLSVLISVISATVVMVLALYYFKRTERGFVDII